MTRKTRNNYHNLLDYLYSSVENFNPESTYELLLALLSTQVNADCCLLINKYEQVLYKSPTLKETKFSHTILKKALEQNESFHIQNAIKEIDLKNANSIVGHIFLSVICIVLHNRNNEIVGALYLDRHELEKKAFSIFDFREVEEFIRKFATILINEGLEKKELNRLRKDHGFEGIIGKSDSMKKIFEQINKVAPTESNVFLQGETGTGKELVARAIHKRSKRADDPFIAVNCSAIPKELLESELFGHERGAFTGATNKRKGKFQLAHNGTLFLDEIGDLEPNLQTKILRALQEREIQPVGSEKIIKVNLRLITASSKDIINEIREGNFRKELFYRINSFQILLPSLRERGNDILLLAKHFITKYCIENGNYIPPPYFTEKAKEKLLSYSWEGNVRELQNVMENLSINFTEGKIITENQLKFYPIEKEDVSKVQDNISLKAVAEEAEKELLKKCLIKHNWRKNKVIKELNTTFPTLVKKMEKYGLEKG
ncbi:MAG: sigma-54-dependent Fis family transcriptional regulator [Candidatus Cloacimonetes bacterium]|nr:sigma-54-dependent Fis family transcriptional regulator [Candidatus Cloacimonadota bacterium]